MLLLLLLLLLMMMMMMCSATSLGCTFRRGFPRDYVSFRLLCFDGARSIGSALFILFPFLSSFCSWRLFLSLFPCVALAVTLTYRNSFPFPFLSFPFPFLSFPFPFLSFPFSLSVFLFVALSCSRFHGGCGSPSRWRRRGVFRSSSSLHQRCTSCPPSFR